MEVESKQSFVAFQVGSRILVQFFDIFSEDGQKNAKNWLVVNQYVHFMLRFILDLVEMLQ